MRCSALLRSEEW